MDNGTTSGNKGTYISFWVDDAEMEVIQRILDALRANDSKANRSQAVRYAISHFDDRYLPAIPKAAAPAGQILAMAM